MTKELELSKKLAVLGWIFRKGLITEDEYNRTRIHIMGEYDVISFIVNIFIMIYSVGSSRYFVAAYLTYTDRFLKGVFAWKKDK